LLIFQSAKKYEREAILLHERIEELEPLLTETQQERYTLQKQNEQQRQERSELLLRVFKDVNRFLGTEVSEISSKLRSRGLIDGSQTLVLVSSGSTTLKGTGTLSDKREQ
jgi:hypothetical protein